MDFDNLSGSFGTETPRQINNIDLDEKTPKRIRGLFEKLKGLDYVKIVDIVFCTIIAVALIVIFCNWETVINRLFMSFLFPIIKSLAKIIGILAGVFCVGGALTAGFYRRRRWRY